MPGKPQVWYLDLFAGTNDYEGMRRAGKDGHKEINRTNLTLTQIEERLNLPVVQQQLELLRFRNSCEAFGFEAEMSIEAEGSNLVIHWNKGPNCAWLKVDFGTGSFCYGTV